MKKFYVLFVGLFLLNNVASTQEFPGDLATELQSIIDEKISSTGLKGLAVNIILDDDSEWTGFSGIRSGTSPIDTSLYFDFGGQRNSILTTTLLKMQEDGLLSIEDSIGKYLSDMDMINTSIAIKRCFNHTSGFGDYWEPYNEAWTAVFSDRSKVWTLTEMLDYVPEGDTSEDPGYDISQTNHLVMALLIEAITGNPVGEEVQSRVLDPLGLNGSVFPVGEFDKTLLNGVWKYNGGSPDDHSGLSQEAYLSSRVSWVGKIRDNAHFTRALHSGQVLNETNTQFLYEKVTESKAAYDNPREGTVVHYGNGVSLYTYGGKKVYGHSGNSLHTTASFHLPDENITITLSLNAFDSNEPMGYLFDELFEAVMFYEPEDTTTGIFSKTNTNAFTIFPNPASDYINIELSGQVAGTVDISVVDMSGRTVIMLDESNVYSIDNLIRLPLGEELEEGYYLLKIATASAVTAKPFLLTR